MDPQYWNIGKPSEQLIEECSEVIQIICKGLRFGWNNYHPNDPEKTQNYQLALEEIKDLERRIFEFKQWVEIYYVRFLKEVPR